MEEYSDSTLEGGEGKGMRKGGIEEERNKIVAAISVSDPHTKGTKSTALQQL